MYLDSFKHEINEVTRKYTGFVESTKLFLGVRKIHRFVDSEKIKPANTKQYETIYSWYI